jgi:protein-L-isoaspartate(D-aspartate) O-methyltransferase
MSAPLPAGPGSPKDLVRVVRAEGVRDRRVLAAYWAVPRAGFVPPAAVGQAYLDTPIRIPHGQVTTQPSLIAAMVAALELHGSERVLEVGTGLGFQTAILALLTVVVGDGTLGVPDHAPYQAIVVAAAAPRVPPLLVEQLAPGGRLVHPVGPGGHEQVTAFHKEAGRLIADTRLTPARFVPLIGAHGSPSRDDQDGR